MEERLLIFYDYFDPAFKAGGPSRSLLNLVNLLGQRVHVSVITGNNDLDGSMLNVESDKWCIHSSGANVIYLSKHNRSYARIRGLIKELRPKVIYVNGIYSYFSFICPFIIAQRLKVPIVIAPRGMLQKNALAQKWLKKKAYIILLRLFLKHRVQWQLTNQEEYRDFIEIFPKYKDNTHVIGNVPTILVAENNVESKTDRKVIFIGTVALVGAMKNHDLVIKALKNITDDVRYLIYGPIINLEYWKVCQSLIRSLPPNIHVEYKGELKPYEVPGVISRFHYYVQPSKSENFGHSIFEAMSLGVPVITSQNTPWKSLKEKNAGWNVNATNEIELVKAFKEAFSQSFDDYSRFCRGAQGISRDYIRHSDLANEYFRLFNIVLS